MNIERLTITKEENAAIDHIAQLVVEKYDSAVNPAFIYEARFLAYHFPQRILRSLHDFKYREDGFGVLQIKGHLFDDAFIGPTPSTIDCDHSMRKQTFKMDAIFVLYNSLLGDLIGWQNQRNGDLINDIIPVKGFESEQLSVGSESLLEWHTEEAFHPFRADFLSLMCLRNPDRVPTTIGSIKEVQLSENVKKILFEQRFRFHMDKNFTVDDDGGDVQASVLFGDFNDPYVRIDPAFMSTLPGDTEASNALSAIVSQFETGLRDMCLEQGDICFIDNYRVVHGRRPFTPRYNGTDRWLKRINVTNDLRKSRAVRTNSQSRSIITD